MKKILLTICMQTATVFIATAQVEKLIAYLPLDTTTNRYSINKVISLEGMKLDEIFKKAGLFLKTDREKFFISNGQKNQGWVYGMGINKHQDKQDVNDAKSDIGFNSEDKASGTLIGRLVIRNEGSMMGCIRLMIIMGDVILQCKEGKTRVSLTNFSYRHYNISTGREECIWGNDKGNCRSVGTLESLSLCNHCENRKRQLYQYVLESGESLIKKYSDYMISKNIITNEDW